MSSAIAIVGLACRFADARSPQELWQTVIAQRRAFRRIPAKRLRLEDYADGGGAAADSLYCREAAVLEGWVFDRVRFRIGQRTFETTDLAHWLALETAAEALADAGFTDGEGLPRERCGVLVGNTLTGEFSRSGLLRLRWPYVSRQVAAELQREGWSRQRRDAFLERLERSYKLPFPEPTEDSLAGGLSNTIAGRISNHFDLHGGGYTVDGACASSLLAVANACSALAADELDAALVGGVDLSLDPFELVGFARTGALARGEMRVYDRRPTGFLPGEGCGFVLLVRQADAEAGGRRIYARLRGWGISSDGRGGLTRPEEAGQLRAVKRAYARAGLSADSMALFEGHGTGTEVGDTTELAVLDRARREASGGTPAGRAAIGSIKANIGHTKAAAGVAGLIKAAMALDRQVVPPITGCREPHPILASEESSLRAPTRPEPWPEDARRRAAVSGAGFGGINAHLVLEGAGPRRPGVLGVEDRLLADTPRAAELIAVAAPDRHRLREALAGLLQLAPQLSHAEVTDLAAELGRRLGPSPAGLEARAVVIASTPRQLEERLGLLAATLDEATTGPHEIHDPKRGIFLGLGTDSGAAAGPPAPEGTDAGTELLAGRFVRGRVMQGKALFGERFARPFDPDRRPVFLRNPCEAAPAEWTGPRREKEPVETEAENAGTDREPPAERREPLALVKELLAEQADLPLGSIASDDRLLSDLHLSSISVAELATEAAQRLGLPPPVAATELADASVAEIAATLEELAERKGRGKGAGEATRWPDGVDSWTRLFVVEERRRPLTVGSPPSPPAGTAGEWTVVAPPNHPLAEPCRRAFAESGLAGGVLLLLPELDSGGSGLEEWSALICEAVRAALGERGAAPGERRFVLAQLGSGAACLARTLHLEAPEIAAAAVELPLEAALDPTPWSRRLVDEVRALSGFSAARYDAEGRRFQSFLSHRPESTTAVARAQLGPDDVLLVTGGGKGIGAECALALARAWGVRLALVGRSGAREDRELAANLERLEGAGAKILYLQADVGEAAELRRAVDQATAALGPIRGILHAAGVNVPRLLAELTPEDLRAALRPKLFGLRHLLAAVDPESLQLLVGFGSLIARSGLPGEAHYGLANALLRREIERFAGDHPDCQALCVEWTVWSGVGMGDRLGRLDALARRGISAVGLDEGTDLLRRLLERPHPASMVACGRIGETPTLEWEPCQLPLLRFLERPRLHVPGVELIVEAELSSGSDPYLDDHVPEDVPVVPGVVGLEAMAQVFGALTGGREPVVFEDVRFERAIPVPHGQTVTLRVAALARREGGVDLVVRSSRTAFKIDHMRARCRAAEPETGRKRPSEPPSPSTASPSTALVPAAEIYGPVLFQGPRFQRLLGFAELRATACRAEIGADTTGNDWFGAFHPQELVLGDLGARDACVHAVQACIPHVAVLPVRVERLRAGKLGAPPGPLRLDAVQRSQTGDRFVFDLEIRDGSGVLAESWSGLELARLGPQAAGPRLVEWLWAPFLERRLGELLPGASLSIAIERNGRAAGESSHRAARERAVRRLLGEDAVLDRRPDGKPESEDAKSISISRCRDLVLAVAGRGRLGCDVEAIAGRDLDTWADLLGPGRRELWRLAETEGAEDPDASATRIWSVIESLKKAGARHDAPLVLAEVTDDGWMLFDSGNLRAATVVLAVAGGPERVAIGILAESGG